MQKAQECLKKPERHVNYKLLNDYLWVMLNILHFGGRLGISHFHLHANVNLLVKEAAKERKAAGR